MASAPVYGICKINVSQKQQNTRFRYFTISDESKLQVSHAKYKECQNQLDQDYNELEQICEGFKP